MARARNIKPAFFSNDLLAEIDPVGRLLFIGLWTIADFKGDIEWREKRIKAQVLPYDNCDVKDIAINLDKLGFIRFYSDNGTTYINIINFTKHQNPHKNEREKGSEIPAYTEFMRQAIDLKGLTINRDLSGLNQDENGTNPADSLILNPESLSLNPLSLTPQSSKPDYDSQIKEVFQYWVNAINKTNRTSLTSLRRSKIQSRLKDGYSVSDIKQAIDNVAKDEFLVAGGHTDIEMICRSDTNLEKYRDAVKMSSSDIKNAKRQQSIEDFSNEGGYDGQF
jgi:hypothetical protein